MAKALVLVAEGSEEIETVTIVDVLRRASIDVVLAGTSPSRRENDTVVMSRLVRIAPDVSLNGISLEAEAFSAVVIPGGLRGVQNMCACPLVIDTVKRFAERGLLIAAICAAPVLLKEANVGLNHRATVYPSLAPKVSAHFEIVDEKIVHDRQLLTGQGPAAAMMFAIKIVEILASVERAAEISADLLL